MNTIIHVAGILAAVWLAYACFVPIGGDQVQATTQTVAQVGPGHPLICVTSDTAFAASGMIRIEGDYYDYRKGGGICTGETPGAALSIDGVTTSTYGPGVDVSQVIDPVMRQARYLGWAFMMLALLLVPATIVAMRQDYLYPAGDDA